MGYDGQTMTIYDTTYFDGANNNAPSTTSTPLPTSGVGTEYSGGLLGDTLYLRDYLLVKDVYGNVTANSVKYPTSSTSYWLASRNYFYPNIDAIRHFGVHIIDYNSGLTNSAGIVKTYNDPGWTDRTWMAGLRPIVTLNQSVRVAGESGTKADPYTLTK
ncbi:MAG: hypothetical protein IJI60_00110 [Bacilli bacterium]|nr:hypothetical protein [Bacilli bacterium]